MAASLQLLFSPSPALHCLPCFLTGLHSDCLDGDCGVVCHSCIDLQPLMIMTFWSHLSVGARKISMSSERKFGSNVCVINLIYLRDRLKDVA